MHCCVHCAVVHQQNVYTHVTVSKEMSMNRHVVFLLRVKSPMIEIFQRFPYTYDTPKRCTFFSEQRLLILNAILALVQK